jgi:hypothetical protein
MKLFETITKISERTASFDIHDILANDTLVAGREVFVALIQQVLHRDGSYFPFLWLGRKYLTRVELRPAAGRGYLPVEWASGPGESQGASET